MSGNTSSPSRMRALARRLLTQNFPCDIWAQVLAPHLPAGQSLDCRTMFRGDTPTGILPLADGSLRDLQRDSKRGLRAHDPRRAFNWMFHVQHS